MHLATGQLPDQPAIDRAETQLAPFRASAQPIDIVEQPGELGAGEIGIEQQPGFFRERRFEPLRFQRLAQGRGAPILPDDGAMHGAAGRPLPKHDCLALIGDTDRGDVGDGDGGFRERGLHCGDDARPDLVSIVLDPTGIGVVLRKFLLADASDLHRPVEYDRTR